MTPRRKPRTLERKLTSNSKLYRAEKMVNNFNFNRDPVPFSVRHKIRKAYQRYPSSGILNAAYNLLKNTKQIIHGRRANAYMYNKNKHQVLNARTGEIMFKDVYVRNGKFVYPI